MRTVGPDERAAGERASRSAPRRHAAQSRQLPDAFLEPADQLFGKGFNTTFHDFRETTSTELSDAGCTENEIASLMDWVIGAEVPMSKNYVKRTRQLALNAFNKWRAAAFTEKDVVVPI